MFKPAKFDGRKHVSALSQAKSSVRRGLRKKLQEQYPDMEDTFEDMLPKKGNVSIAKCPGRVELVVVEKMPVFFSADGQQHIPTLRLLHQFPNMLPNMVVDEGAAPHIMSGSNVFCAGFTGPAGVIPEGLEADTVVAVHVQGKKHAIAIGRTKMSGAEMKAKNRGTAVTTLHYLADGLWPIIQLD